MRLLFFILLAWLEIFIFIKVSQVLGILVTLLLLILTSFLGASLVRAQGILSIMRFRQKLASGMDPTHEVGKGFFSLLGGFLLFLPGFFTDFLGLILLFPRVQSYLAKKFMPTFFIRRKRENRGNGYTVDGEFERKKDNPKEIENKNDHDH